MDARSGDLPVFRAKDAFSSADDRIRDRIQKDMLQRRRGVQSRYKRISTEVMEKWFSFFLPMWGFLRTYCGTGRCLVHFRALISDYFHLRCFYGVQGVHRCHTIPYSVPALIFSHSVYAPG